MSLPWDHAVCYEIAKSPSDLDKIRGLLKDAQVRETLGRKRWAMSSNALQPRDGNLDNYASSSAPLHFAVMRDKSDVVRVLVKEGFDVNSIVQYQSTQFGTVPRYFETPLHIAARNNLADMAMTLLELGADVQQLGSVRIRSTDVHFGTPLQFATKYGAKAELLSVLQGATMVAQHQSKNSVAVATGKIKMRHVQSAELERALVTQTKIENLQKWQARKDAKFAERIFALEKQLRTEKDDHRMQKLDNEAQIKFLKASKDYRSQSRLEILAKEVEELDAFVDTVKEAVVTEETKKRKKAVVDDDDDHLCCTVCLVIPAAVVFCCQRCEHMLCEDCRKKSGKCPSCRQEFEGLPPVRSRLAERMIAAAIKRKK